MKKPFVKKSRRAAGLVTLLVAAPMLVLVQGCTDLDETPVSSITPENFYRNEDEVIGGLASVYAELRNTLGDYYNAGQVSADEHIVPTRGSDWFDGGQWLELDGQTWASNSAAVGIINGAWNNLFRGVARANVVLEALENVTVADQATVVAELRALRAFYYYLLMDLFGGVQIVTTTEIMPRARNTRAEVFDFIEQELEESRADLPVSWPSAMHGRMTQGAADAILASMYLNARVFTGTVTASGLQPGAARWQDAVEAADRILNSSAGYMLEPNWTDNFDADNFNSRENIFVVKHLNRAGLGLNFLMRALHYNQHSPAPWNGFATIGEVYDAFDADDARRNIFLTGCQVNLETGEPAEDRQGNPLCYTKDIPDITNALEHHGYRIVKWPVDPAHVAENHGNDVAYFRLAEIMLIKAEAQNELNNTADALLLLNTIRARAFEPDEPLVALSQAQVRDAILNERLFELTAEAKRRQDLIRHGRYTAAWTHKPAREGYRILMPIPQSQLNTNPLLEQNPGYN